MNTQEFKNYALAIDGAIKDLGEVPSGHLYAQLMGRLSLSQYESIIDFLIEHKRVVKDGYHVLKHVA